MDNLFDQFDGEESQLVITSPPSHRGDPFAQFDESDVEPSAPQTLSAPSLVSVPSASPAIPGVSFQPEQDDTEIKGLLSELDARNKKASKDALDKARGDSFLEGVSDPQQYLESVKGIVPGAIRFGGTTLKGGAAIQSAPGMAYDKVLRERLAVMDSIDGGERLKLDKLGKNDPHHRAYWTASPADRKIMRDEIERQVASYKPTPVEQRALYQAGETVTEFSKGVLPAAPGYEDAVGRQVGEGLGSLIAGLPMGFLGRVPAAAFFGAGGSGEALERAIDFDKREKTAGRAGLTEEQKVTAALWGVAPGTTDMLPVEFLLGRLKIPAPIRGRVASAIGRIGGQAFVEGMQESGQGFLQNLIAQEIYNPQQRLTEGLVSEGGLGAGVGGISQAAKEMARLALQSFANRRARNAPFPGDTLAPAAQPQTIEDAAALIDNARVSSEPNSEITQFEPRIQRPTESRSVDVIQYIRGKGGLKPSGELAAVNAERYPGLVREGGLDADKMREALVEAGYLEESGPDQPAITTPQDVYDLIGRQISGDRVFPVAEQAGVRTRNEQQSAYEFERELQTAEQNFVLPEIAKLDSEVGNPVIRSAYARLTNDEKAETIERFWRGGEDISDVIEEIAIRNEDAPSIAAMAIRRVTEPEQVEQVRQVVAERAPELLADFDGLVASLGIDQATTAVDAGIAELSAIEAAAPAAPANLRQSLATFIDSKTPFTKAADSLGVSEADLAPLVEEAVQKGWLRKDASGKIRRTAKTARTGNIAALAIADAAPDAIPGEGNVAKTDAAADRWDAIKAAVNKSAAKILPADVRIDFVDSIEIMRLRKEDELLALREQTAFVRWFGDSKVVDEDGQPKVVYHGTARGDFEEFDTYGSRYGLMGQGGYFTENPAVASEYTEKDIVKMKRRGESVARTVYPVYLRIVNPLDMDAAADPEVWAKAFDEYIYPRDVNGMTNEEAYRTVEEILADEYIPSADGAEIMQDGLRSMGHDGITHIGGGRVDPNGVLHRVWIAFDPTQIKSATGNRGTFDPADPRMSYALRTGRGQTESEKSAMLAAEQEGVSDDRSAEDRAIAGGEGVKTGSEQSEAGIPAGASEGVPGAGAEGRDARILRAESGTYRADGSIIAGRLSSAEGRDVPGASDAGAIQQVGDTEEFSIGGFSGRVTAEEVLSEKHLRDAGIPLHRRRLAKLTYRVYALDAEVPTGKRVAFKKVATPLLAQAKIAQHPDGTWEVNMVEVNPANKRKGLASTLYAAIEEDLGIRMSPSGVLTADGLKFWQRRSPVSVQWHQWSSVDQFYVSPNWIDTRIDDLKLEIANIQRKAVIKPLDDVDLRSARSEIKRLIAIWQELPDQARAAKDSMFALRAFHGSPHDFDRFSMDKIGTGEGAQVFGHGLYFAENELVAASYRDNLAVDTITIDGKPVSDQDIVSLGLSKIQGELDKIEADAVASLDRSRSASEPTETDAAALLTTVEKIAARRQQNIVDAEAFLEKVLAVKSGEVKTAGNLYEVELKVEPEDLLDWDKPIHQQSERVQSAIRKTRAGKLFGDEKFIELQKLSAERNALQERANVLRDAPDMNLSEVTNVLDRRDSVSRKIREIGTELANEYNIKGHGQTKLIIGSINEDTYVFFGDTPEDASRSLREAGIPGIRYLDQGSRDAGEGSRNIVIFDDSLITITKKNGKPVTQAERQKVVDELFALRQPLAIRRPPQKASDPQALGRTDPNNFIISLAMRAIEAEAASKGKKTEQEAVRVLRHEAVEFFKANNFFHPKEWQLLERTARQKGWIETTGVRQAYQDLYASGMSEAELNQILIKEAIAEQYSEFHLGRKEFTPAITRVFQRIKDYLRRITNWMKGQGFQTWEDVFTRIDEGEFKRRFEAAFGSQQEARTGAAPMQATAGKLADSPARQASAGTDQPSMSLADIIGQFNKALGLTVRQGRIDSGLKRAAAQIGAEVRGQASRETGVIRLQVPNEIDTLAHEGGHALENRFKGDLDAIKQQFAAELTPLASPGPDALSEGFAEWFRRYVTNPAASVRTAPGFEAAFEEFLDGQDPEMLASIQGIRTGYQEWISAPSGGAVASSIATTVPPGSTKEFVREFKEGGLRNTFFTWIDRIYTAVFDDLHPIRMTVDGLMEIASKNLKLPKGSVLGLKTVNNPYRLLRLARDGYSAGHMDLLYGVHGYKSSNPQGPSFRDAIGTAFGGFDKSQWSEAISKDFGAYLTSRRMVQEWVRFQAGELTAPPDKFSLADHQQSIKDFEAKYRDFAQGAQQLYQFQNNMLRKKLDAGLITQELYDKLIAKQDYVPVMRDMSDRGGVEGRSAARKDKFSIIRKFRGSQRDVINPLESIAKDAYETAMIIARNDAVKALDALARAAGPDGGKFAERIPASQMKATQVNVQDAIKAAAKDAGVDPADLQIMLQAVDDQLGGNAIAQIWRAGDVTEKGEAIIYLWEKGERIPIQMADGQFGHDMLHAFAGLNREAADWWVNILSLPSTILRTGVTAAPDFIGANFLRDQLSAWVLTRDFVPFYDGARGIYSDLTMKDVSRIYARAGGIMGGSNVAALHESRVKREVLQLRRKGIRFTLNPLTRDFWRMTEFSETGTRLAVFQRAFDRARKDGLQDWEATVEAAYTARDYIDFGRRGSRMLAARRLIPFFNAALQGLDREVRGLRGKISEDRILQEAISPYIKSRTGQPLSLVERKNKGRAVRVFAYTVVLGMLGIAQSLLYKDDEEYEEISDYIKSTHWLFRFNGEWVRIPKPFTLATVSNFFERTFDYVYKDDKTAPEKFLSGLYEITVPPHSVPGLAVTTELLTDYSFFTGRPIVGGHLKSLPPELQFNAYASEFGKWFGKQVGISPAYVDHFITGFGASYGREFVNASDQFMPALGRATDGLFGLPKGPVADPATQDYFFVRRFTTDPARGSNSVRQFWDLMSFENGQFIRAANGYKHLIDKVRDVMGAQEFLDGLNDEEKAYALLQMGNKDGRSKLRNLHPLNRAEEIVSITNGLKKEINLNRLYKDAGKKKDGEQIVLSPSEMRTVSDLLTDIQMREARNSLIALRVRGWEQRKPLETESVYAELAAAAPEVHEEMVRRLKTKKLPSYETVVKGWPVARDRILEDGQKAIISDLYSRDADAGRGEGMTLQ